MRGPNAAMNSPLATMWSPNAAGNFSRLQCSDIVSVKLMSVAPLKNPFITRVTINAVYSVCSASAITLQNGTIHRNSASHNVGFRGTAYNTQNRHRGMWDVTLSSLLEVERCFGGMY